MPGRLCYWQKCITRNMLLAMVSFFQWRASKKQFVVPRVAAIRKASIWCVSIIEVREKQEWCWYNHGGRCWFFFWLIDDWRSFVPSDSNFFSQIIILWCAILGDWKSTHNSQNVKKYLIPVICVNVYLRFLLCKCSI